MDNPIDFDIPSLRQKMLEHLGENVEVYPQALEKRYPRILAQLVELWGRPMLDAYLDSLLVADRVDRQGFPDEIAHELFRLSMLHNALWPTTSQTMGWSFDESGTDFSGGSDRRFNR
jgi:hypothetical protein